MVTLGTAIETKRVIENYLETRNELENLDALDLKSKFELYSNDNLVKYCLKDLIIITEDKAEYLNESELRKLRSLAILNKLQWDDYFERINS